MEGFRVEGQQLGAAQTETVAHPGECRHFGHDTKLHSFKSHNTHEDFWHFCDKGDNPHEDFRCIPWGEGGGYRHAT